MENSIAGENFVILVGQISRPSLKQVGQNNISLFKGSLAIPTPKGTKQYIKIGAWGEVAEALNKVQPQFFIKVQGHIEESSYNGKCRHCNGEEKKYWTEVIVDNYIIITGEE